MEFQILGPFEVWDGAGSVGGPDPEISPEQTEVKALAETISELPERET
jgi:hypothetical protein